MSTTVTPQRRRGKAQKTLALIDTIHDILSTIQPATVRAVCYQLFIRGLIKKMSKGETNKVSIQTTWSRENGVIPWSWIVDETRRAERVLAFENPAEYLEELKQHYRRDRWTDQPARLQVWSEKGTIRGTLAPILNAYGIAFRVMHGYGSSTAIHQAAVESRQKDTPLTVLYVGDWDPSGLHMSEVDLPNRLAEYGGNVEIIRVALTSMDTMNTLGNGKLPAFPAETKAKDPRYDWYRRRYGRDCWELDALNPNILRDRVEQEIVERLDRDAWDRASVTEKAEIDSLTSFLSAWPGIPRQAPKYPWEAR